VPHILPDNCSFGSPPSDLPVRMRGYPWWLRVKRDRRPVSLATEHRDVPYLYGRADPAAYSTSS
jgi:hypothetical protein